MKLPEEPKEYRVTKREAKALLATGGWRNDPEMTKAVGFEAFVNGSGQSMVLLPGRMGADLCDDRAARLRYYLAIRAMPPQHVLEGLFPYGEFFPQEVPRLVAQLATETGLAPADLNGGVESLEKVERVLRKKPGPRAWMTESRFPQLVAYVGEVMRTASDGEWRMELSHGVWEPWIVTRDGRRYPPFLVVYEELERGRGGSIWGATRGRLWAHRLSGSRRGSN
jgi:hypothetical protein